MKLNTPVKIEKPTFSLDTNSIITGIGSCFAEYAMKQLEALNINVCYNPNGIVYNSHSIKVSLEYITGNKTYSDDNFIFYNNLWHSWNHHGSFSSECIKELKNNISKANNIFKEELLKSDLFILTPSSSVTYCLKENDLITANCHKYPGNRFYTKILSCEENFSNLNQCIELIHSINPRCNIIMTLSPVRHYPGNLILNGRSKANLLSAIHKCIEEKPYLYYFPSYEILLDELRDYRFFADDMLHPSELARKIIISKFIETYYSLEAQKEIKIRKKEFRTKLNVHK